MANTGWGAMGAGAWGSKQAPVDDEPDGSPPPVKGGAPSAPPQAPAQPLFGAPGGAYANAFQPSAPAPSQPGTSGGIGGYSNMQNYAQAKEAELKKREAELAKKELELKKLEKELKDAGVGLKKKNWPRCAPIWYHDIAGEIPEKSRRVVREVYMCWWGLVVCLSWQLFCASVMLGHDASDKVPSWFLAVIYWITGIPLSVYFWYRRLYNAARDDGTVGYIAFFLFFSVHIAFCIWCAIAVPFSAERWSFSGFVTAMEAFDKSAFAGIIYIIGASFWTVESVWCFWCLKDAYFFFRGMGGVKEVKAKAANEAALAAFKASMGSGSQAV